MYRLLKMGFVLTIVILGAAVDSTRHETSARTSQQQSTKHERSSSDRISAGDVVIKVNLKSSDRDKVRPLEEGLRSPRGPYASKLVAVPECDEIGVDWAYAAERNGSYRWQTSEGNTMGTARPVEIAAISRIRSQRVAVLAIWPDMLGHSGKNDVLYVRLRFTNARGAVRQNAGPMNNLLDKTMARLETDEPSRAAAKGLPALSGSGGGAGTVTWTSGNTWQAAGSSAVDAEIDYLIIMADELSDSLVGELANKRAEFNGLNVGIVKMSQIDEDPDTVVTPDTIRTLIKYIYDSGSAAHMADGLLGYVLLLGDATRPDGSTVIPSYYGFLPNQNMGASDSFYALMSEDDASDDLFPDLYIGRIPVDAVSLSDPPDPDWELRNVVSKILSYQQSGTSDRRVLLFSGEDPVDQLEPIPFYGHVMDIIPNYVDVDTLHRNEYTLTDYEFSEMVADSLNSNDYWILGFVDHGNPRYLPDSFFARDFDVLTNTSYPLYLNVASDAGHYDLPIANFHGYANFSPKADEESTVYSPAVELDSCDVIVEHLLLQEHGIIGAIATSRTNFADDGALLAESYYRAIFEDNAYELGEILVTTMLLCYPSSPDGEPEFQSRNLTLFGDPALNIMWENGVVEPDTVDIVVKSSDIVPIEAFHGKYSSGATVQIAVGVSNNRPTTAYDVPFQIWDGVPGEGTLKGGGTLSHVDGYGQTTWDTLTVSGLSTSAPCTLYVLADTTSFAEPTIRNNLASRVIYAYEYDYGFPLLVPDRVTQGITAADIRPDSPGLELLVQGSRGLLCYSSDGELLWQKISQHHLGKSDLVNCTPIVGNIYQDGHPYVLFIDSLLYVLDVYGNSVDEVYVGSSNYFNTVKPGGHTGIFQRLAIADIDPDNDTLELILLAGKPNLMGYNYLRAYSLEGSGGTELWEHQIGAAFTAGDRGVMGVGDIDGDGRSEVLVRMKSESAAQGADSLYCFTWDEGEATYVPAWDPIPGGAQSDAAYELSLSPDGDSGQMRILMSSNSVGTFPKVSYLVEVDATGSYETILSENASAYQTSMSIGDLDTDGDLDYVLAYGEFLSLYDEQAQNVATKELETNVGAGVTNSGAHPLFRPLIADVTGSSDPEIIIVYGGLNRYSENRSSHIVEVLDADLETEFRFEFLFSWDLSNIPYEQFSVSAPTVGDFDLDGSAELAFVSTDSVFHVIELGSMGTQAPYAQQFANPMQTNNLEQPIKGVYDEPVSLFNNVTIGADVIFNDAVYVDGTATIRVADEDAHHIAAGDSNRVEIWIHDRFKAIGSEEHPIRFLGWDGNTESTDSSAWWGIMVSDSTGDASGEFVHCEIRNAIRAISARDRLEVRNCLIDVCDYIGISVATADTVIVDSTAILGSQWGLNILQGTTALVSNTSVSGCTRGAEAYSGGTIRATNSTFDDCDIGMFVQQWDSLWARGSIEDCGFSGNDIGLWIEDLGDSSATVLSSTFEDNTTAGIYVEGSGNVTIRENTMSDNEIGVYSYSSSPRIEHGNTIQGSNGGIKADQYSTAVVESCTVTQNTIGVVVTNSSNPDLGTTGQASGHNILNQNVSYFVSNTTGGTTMAENNYWGGGHPVVNPQCFPRSYKIYGSVDYDPSLCDSPSLVSLADATTAEHPDARIPQTYGLGQNYPNPFNPSTTVAYQVPAPGAKVTLVLYDVMGRVVTTLLDEVQPPGFYTVTWDGTNRNGARVASGVYFLRMRSGSFVKSRKLVILK